MAWDKMSELDKYGVWIKNPPRQEAVDDNTIDLSDFSFLDAMPDFPEDDDAGEEKKSPPAKTTGSVTSGLDSSVIPDTFDEETAMFSSRESESKDGIDIDSEDSQPAKEYDSDLLQIKRELAQLRSEVASLKNGFASLVADGCAKIKEEEMPIAPDVESVLSKPVCEAESEEDIVPSGFDVELDADNLLEEPPIELLKPKESETEEQKPVEAIRDDQITEEVLPEAGEEKVEEPVADPAVTFDNMPELSDGMFDDTDKSVEVSDSLAKSLSEPVDETEEVPTVSALINDSSGKADFLDDIPDSLLNDLNKPQTEAEKAAIDDSQNIASVLPEELIGDIKSVLSCMDKLLESLPDEKIKEFASSPQFAVYKKLFSDLGID